MAVLDLFSGIGNGLAGAIRSLAVCVSKYRVCEADPIANAVSRHNLNVVSQQHPGLLPPQVLADEQIGCLPQDIRLVSEDHLRAAGLLDEPHLLILGTWECQGRSPAGHQLGIHDHRHSLVRHLHRILALCNSYRFRKGLPPANIFLENVTVSSLSPTLVREDQQLAEKLFGKPVAADSARFGSYAHRARFYWMSWIPQPILQRLVDSWKRPDGLRVQQILDSGHFSRPAIRTESDLDSAQFPGYYPCNVEGQDLRALPTFVSFHGSNAYRSLDRNGLLRVESGGATHYQEPTADERERAMGMPTGSTRLEGVSELDRRALLGRTLDLNSVISLFSLAAAWTERCDNVLANHIAADCDSEELTHRLEDDEVQGLLDRLQVLSVAFEPPALEPGQIPDGFEFDINPGLPPDQRAAILNCIRRRLDAIAFSPEQCYNKYYTGGCFTVGLDKMKHPSVFSKARRLPDVHANEVERVVAELSKHGVVVLAPDSTNYASALVVAPKKDAEGNYTKWRVCVDYRPLNLLCSNLRYQMPLPEEIFSSQTSGGQNIFSTGDIMWGFHIIKMAIEDQELTAFWGPAMKLYMYTRGPFGLKNLPAYFQSVMDRVFAGLAPFFIDDFLRGDVIPNTPDCPWGTDCSAHIASLDQILKRAAENGLCFSAAKLHLGYASIDSLGHTVVHDPVTKTTAVTPQMNKCQAIVDLSAPRNKSELSTFLGMAGYYRKYLRDLSRVTAPLRNLLAKHVQWSWGKPQNDAFLAVKEMLVSPAVLKMPVKGLPYRLATDWSEYGYGAVLSQIHPDGNEYPVAFASRACNKHEKNYASYKGEMLAAVWGVEHFRMYLLGQSFTLVTDHQPLAFLMKSQKLSGLYARWACRLQEYDITVTYRPGSANCNADGISRFPLPSSERDWEIFREGIEYYSTRADAHSASALPSLSPPSLADAAVAFTAAVLSLHPLAAQPTTFLVASLQPTDGLVDLSELLDSMPAPSPIRSKPDIHCDPAALHYLENGLFSPDLSAAERHRIRQRVSDYFFVGTGETKILYRRMTLKDKTVGELVVPRPSERRQLVLNIHGQSHFRLERTHSILEQRHWWYGMKDNIRYILLSCPSCLRKAARFYRRAPTLNPLPIHGIGYSVHIDLAGPFVPSTPDGFTYFMVMVDRTTKYLEVEPIKGKEAATCARALEKCWIYRWGCMAEIVHDCGKEWEGEMSLLLAEQGVDVRYTSANTPQSNGQAEIEVKTVKGCLYKCINSLPDQDRSKWAVLLPRLVLSYNASVHASTRISPYFFITARNPVIPFALEHQFREPITAEQSEEELSLALLARADAIRRHGIMALGNLKIAQHRQTMNYAQNRSGTWVKPEQMFRRGDCAIMRVHGRPNLDNMTTSDPLRVLDVRPLTNMLILQGIDGGILKDNQIHWAPYHHSAAVPLIDPNLVRARLATYVDDAKWPCWICDDATSDMDDLTARIDPDKIYTMVQCSLCAQFYHLSCIHLTDVPPEDDWRCPTCLCFWFNPPGETFYDNHN